jgi:hypothetical protein
MATPDESIAALEEALSSGALKVDFPDGKSITYRDSDALRSALDYFKAQRRQASGQAPVSVSVGAYFRG